MCAYLGLSRDEYWSVVQTAPAQEVRAREYLMRAGCDVFLPMIETLRSVRGRAVVSLRPLFPSYIFVRTRQVITSILGTIGVLRIVFMAGVPARLSVDFINRLSVIMDELGVVRLPKNVPMGEMFRRGQKVVASSGPFELFTGVFDGMSGAQRCRVLYDILGSETPVEIDVVLLRAG